MSWKKKNEKDNLTLLEEYKNGNIESRNELFNFYKRVALEISKNYYNLGVSKEDIIQSAYEGILIGIDKSLTIKSNNLSGEIPYHIRKNIEINILSYYGIYIEKSKTNIIAKIIEVLMAKKHLSSDNVEEISNYLGRKPSEVREILNIINKTNEEVEKSTIEKENSYLNKETLEEVKALLKEHLNESQINFFYFRYYLNLTLREIAAKMNISYQRCGQINSAVQIIIEKIKNTIKDKSENKQNFELMKLKDIFILCEKGNKEALEYLMNYYFPRIMNIIKDFSGFNYTEEELIEIAKKTMETGLKNSCPITNISQLVKYSIAYSIIYRYGFCFIKQFDNEGKIRIFKMLQAKEDFINEFGYLPSDIELGEYMNFDPNLVSDMQKLIKKV